jgi:hypothetical protein
MVRDEMTLGEAEAWRDGWQAAKAEIAAAVQRALEGGGSVACAVAQVRMPKPCREVTGLEYRGG